MDKIVPTLDIEYILKYYSFDYKIFGYRAIGVIKNNKCSHTINYASESLLSRLSNLYLHEYLHNYYG